MPKIEKCLAEYGIASLEEARELCKSKGFDPYEIVKGVQPIAFENAGWAYTLGCAVAIKKGVKTRRRRRRGYRHWPGGFSACPALWPSSANVGPGPRQPGRHAAPR